MRSRVLFFCALALAAAIRAASLAAPFSPATYDGQLGAIHGPAASAFAHEGFAKLRFLPHIAPGPVAFGEVVPYVHHPPLFPILLGVLFRAFGPSEWALRLLPSLATVVSVALLHAIGRRVATPRAAGLAALVFAALPMTGVYGGLPNFEPIVLALSLGTWLAYLRYRDGGRTREAALVCGLLALAVLVDWFGALVALPLTVHALFARPRGPRTFVLAIGLVTVATVAAVLAFYASAWPGTFALLRAQAAHRLSDVRGDDTRETFTALAWFGRQATYAAALFRPCALALAAAALPLGLAGGRPERRRGLAHAGLLALIGLFAIATFPQASFQHAFFGFPLAAAVALAAGMALDAALDLRRPLARAAAVIALAGLAAEGQWATWRTLGATSGDARFRDLGRALAAVVPYRWGIATPGRDRLQWSVIGFYADRAIALGVDAPAALDEVRRAPPRKSAPIRYLAFTRATYARHAAWVRELAARYPLWQDEALLVFDLGPP